MSAFSGRYKPPRKIYVGHLVNDKPATSSCPRPYCRNRRIWQDCPHPARRVAAPARSRLNRVWATGHRAHCQDLANQVEEVTYGTHRIGSMDGCLISGCIMRRRHGETLTTITWAFAPPCRSSIMSPQSALRAIMAGCSGNRIGSWLPDAARRLRSYEVEHPDGEHVRPTVAVGRSGLT
jgi:hypothetical protein